MCYLLYVDDRAVGLVGVCGWIVCVSVCGGSGRVDSVWECGDCGSG